VAKQTPPSGIDFGDGGLVRLPGRRVLVALGVVAIVVAAVLALGPATVFGFVLGGVFFLVAGALLVAYAYHHLSMPFAFVASVVDTERERHDQHEFARSLASPAFGAPPTSVEAPNAARAVAWGLFGLAFPLVAPVAWWYGRDALHFVALSGGALRGERKARIGRNLGLIGMVELGLLFVLIALYPVK
jgi:hypothetical protein